MKEMRVFTEIVRDTALEVVLEMSPKQMDPKVAPEIDVVWSRRSGEARTEMAAAELLTLALWYPGQFDDFVGELRKRVGLLKKDGANSG